MEVEAVSLVLAVVVGDISEVVAEVLDDITELVAVGV
jgi:hypothetical protein